MYHGGGIQKVHEVTGFTNRNKFIRKKRKLDLSEKQVWERLVEFIQDEAKVNEEKS